MNIDRDRTARLRHRRPDADYIPRILGRATPGRKPVDQKTARPTAVPPDRAYGERTGEVARLLVLFDFSLLNSVMMSDTVVVALISSSASMLTAITSVIVVMVTQNKRFDDVNKRLDRIDADLREFFRMLSDLDKRVSR